MTKELVNISIDKIKPYGKNPRKNDSAVEVCIKSIQEVGYISPIIVDENNVILAGHTRYKAVVKLGYQTVECLVITGAPASKKKLFRLLDNKIGEIATWDTELLFNELAELEDLNEFDLSTYNFPEINLDNFFDKPEVSEETNDNKHEKTVKCPHCGKEFEI